MIGYWKALRAAKVARRRYELARLESLIAEMKRHRAESEAMEECRWCLAVESPQARKECEEQFAHGS